MRFWRDVGEAMTEAFQVGALHDCLGFGLDYWLDLDYRRWTT